MRWKISSKIMVAIMVCSAILSATIGSIALFQSSSAMKEKAYQNLLLTAESYANDFSKTTEHVESAVRAMGAAVSATINLEALRKDRNYIEEYQYGIVESLIKNFAETTHGILGAYFDINPELTPHLGQEDAVYGAWYVDSNLNGQFIRERLAPVSRFDPNNPEMKWYYNPVLKGKGVWSTPYYDYDIDLYVISYTAPVYEKGVLIGVVGMDIIFDYFIDIIRSVELYETGHAVLLSENYEYIVNPAFKGGKRTRNLMKGTLESEADGKYLPVVEEMKEKSSGVMELNAKNQKTIVAFAHQSNGYIVMLEVPAQEIFEKLNQIRVMMDGIIIVGILIASGIAYILGRYISKPIERFRKHFDKTIHFDFAEEENEKKVNADGEMAQMILEIESFRSTMRKRLHEIESKNEALMMAYEELTEKVEKSIALNKVLLTLFHAQKNIQEAEEIEKNIQMQLTILAEVKKDIKSFQVSAREIEQIMNIFLLD